MNAVYATGEARMLAWIDAERQAAEARTGSTDIDVVVRDERYGRVLEIWSRWTRAEQAMLAAEADARALGGLAEPWVGAGERVPAPRVCQPRAAAAVSAVDRLRLRAVS